MKTKIISFSILCFLIQFESIAKPYTNFLENNNLNNDSLTKNVISKIETLKFDSLFTQLTLLKNDVNTIIATKEEKKDKFLEIGIDVGWRIIWSNKKELYQPTISKIDTNTYLSFERGNRGSIAAGISFSVFPFKKCESIFKILGFTTNINLLKFVDLEKENALKADGLEGGIGISFKMNKAIYLAFTFEKIFINSVRNTYINDYKDKPIDETIVKYVEEESSMFYRKNRANAVGIKLIYNLNLFK